MSSEGGENNTREQPTSAIPWIIVGGIAVVATTGIIYFLYKNGNLRTPSQAANESISKILTRLKSKNDDEAARRGKGKMQVKKSVSSMHYDEQNSKTSDKQYNASEINNVNKTPKKLRINGPISPISNVDEDDISNLTIEKIARTPTDNVTEEHESSRNDSTAAFLTPYKLPEIDDDEVVSMLQAMVEELEKAKVIALQTPEDSVFYFYGEFMGSIMVMQNVYQEFGFAEYPDVLTVIKSRKDRNHEINEAWLKLESKLNEVKFNHIPFFKGNLSRDEVIFVLDELLRAGKTVLLKINEISNSEDITRTIELAELFLLKNPSKQNYLKFQSAVEDPLDFAFIDDAIIEWKNRNTIAVIVDSDVVFEEFQNQYNLKFMVEVMKPLTEVQNHLMKHYGMGGTNLSQEVSKWQNDPEIKILKKQLNIVMRKLNGRE
jgi:hypothetical protein